MKPHLLLLTALMLSACDKKKKPAPSAAAPAPPPSPAATGARITAVPGAAWSFTGFAHDEDLSGLAAWDERHCLVCTDEGWRIQPGLMDRTARTVQAGAAFPLLPGAPPETEVDAEGVAAAPEEGCYYVTGSHGLGKKKADFQPSRCHVFRIPVDPATGLPGPGDITTASLLPWVEQHPVLGKYARQPLQQNGFNIEGLAWRSGRLYFGVRGPSVDGDAFIIEAETSGLFAGQPQAVLHRLPVGKGAGIRELAALPGGAFLVLTGNACAEASKKQPATRAPGPDTTFRLHHFTPGGETKYLGDIPSPSAKAEGMLLLNGQERSAEVLVLFDSAPGGGAVTLHVTW